MTATDLPRQDLLLKLLKMTTSSNDGECLTAIRKANAVLADGGWDWDQLIHAKIRIIEDPFKNLSNPAPATRPPRATGTTGTTPSRPATTKQSWPLGINPNRFAGWCYCCGTEVVANAGVIFKPYQYHSQAVDDWKVACLSCNQTATVRASAASRQRTYTKKGQARPFVGDLS